MWASAAPVPPARWRAGSRSAVQSSPRGLVPLSSNTRMPWRGRIGQDSSSVCGGSRGEGILCAKTVTGAVRGPGLGARGGQRRGLAREARPPFLQTCVLHVARLGQDGEWRAGSRTVRTAIWPARKFTSVAAAGGRGRGLGKGTRRRGHREEVAALHPQSHCEADAARVKMLRRL